MNTTIHKPCILILVLMLILFLWRVNMQRIQAEQRSPVEDRWDEWLGFLMQLEELAYPTIVHIDDHPDHWPDDEWLRESVGWCCITWCWIKTAR